MIQGLQPAVEGSLAAVFGKWEGPGLTYPYTDSKGLVTTGTGNLIDPVDRSLVLPWVHPDSGAPASHDEIVADWQRVKAAFPAVQSTACARLTTLRLTAAGLEQLLLRTIAVDWHVLCAEFSGLPTWPADAQLALLSIAWAWGAGFPVVWNRIGGSPMGYGDAFKLQCETPDFELASGVMLDASKHEESINPGLVPRDRGEVVMLRNAQAVASASADVARLWYPAEYAA